MGLWVADLEVFVTVGMSWWWHEDGGGGRMVTVSALGLGVLMGAFVGLGFRYLGGVVVSLGVGFSKGVLSRSWPGLDVCADLSGLRREAVWPVGHRSGETKKKREMRREKKKVKIK